MQKQIEYQASLSKKYNEYHSRTDLLNRLQIQKIITYLELDNTKSVIDIGGGAGRLFIPLLKNVDLNAGYFVEQSPNMYNEFHNNLKNNYHKSADNIFTYNIDFNSFLQTYKSYNINQNINAAYFSYSLHQIDSDINNQINILRNTFDILGVDKILLITISESQMNNNILNINSPALDTFDKSRFISYDTLNNNFNIDLYEEETQYINIEKSILLDRIKNKYISSLQILSNTELNDLITKIDINYPNIIQYPDFYNYIVLSK